MRQTLRIGTAGWSIPRALAEHFPPLGSGLERYSAALNAVEINASFYRSIRRSTFTRWREATPAAFRFSVKLPRAVTHEARLVGCEGQLRAFLCDVRELGPALGPLLVQLPPSLDFERGRADDFFAALRKAHDGPVACEPRHASWFEAAADEVLATHKVARVAADPARIPAAAQPGGWTGLAYWRWHGSPRMYVSPYAPAALEALAAQVAAVRSAEAWVIFDNTASGAAAADALALQALLPA